MLTLWLAIVVPCAVYVVATKIGDARIDAARGLIDAVAFAPSTPREFAPVWLRAADAVNAWRFNPRPRTYRAAMRAIREAEMWLALASTETATPKR